MNKDIVIDALREDYATYNERLAAVRRSVDREVARFRDDLIAKRAKEAEDAFAGKLRSAYEEGVLGVSDIAAVIGTGTWAYVRKWRDKAGIPSRSETSGLRKAEMAIVKGRERGFSVANGTLTIYRSWKDKREYDSPVVFNLPEAETVEEAAWLAFKAKDQHPEELDDDLYYFFYAVKTGKEKLT